LKRKVLYLTPYPPIRSGIADYACAFKAAIEAHTRWRLEVRDEGPRIGGNTPRAVLAAYRRVKTWRGDGRLDDVALAHAEIGVKQHEEFWTLFFLARLAPETPFCVTVHDPPIVVAPALYPLALGLRAATVRRALRLFDYTPVGRMIVRSVLDRASGVFVLSEAGREAVRGLVRDPARLKTLPFLAYGASRRGGNDATANRTSKVLFLGFWGPGRGLETLLDAVEKALRRRPGSLQLILAGGVEEGGVNRRYVDAIRARIERSHAVGSIQVLGYVPAESLDSVFGEADVFVLPSRRTGWLSSSSVLFRAMGAGLAIVASDVGVIREEIRHRETGLVVPPVDADALAEALLTLADDPVLRARLGREARAHLEAEHGDTRVAQEAARTYEALGSR
jgi:glycosyltransferase involved in cell wall biosynthesis